MTLAEGWQNTLHTSKGEIEPLNTEQVGKDTIQRYSNLPAAAPSKQECSVSSIIAPGLGTTTVV